MRRFRALLRNVDDAERIARLTVQWDSSESKENYYGGILFAKLGKCGRAADFVEVFG